MGSNLDDIIFALHDELERLIRIVESGSGIASYSDYTMVTGRIGAIRWVIRLLNKES